MKKNSFAELLTGRAELKRQFKFQSLIYCVLIIIGILFCIIDIQNTSFVQNLTMEARAVLEGCGSVFVIAGAIRLIKNIRILKNEEILKAYEIRIKDERNIAIQKKALSTAVIVCIWIGLVFGLIYLPYNEVVSYTILYSICVLMLVYLIFTYIFNKIM